MTYMLVATHKALRSTYYLKGIDEGGIGDFTPKQSAGRQFARRDMAYKFGARVKFMPDFLESYRVIRIKNL